MLVWHVVPVGAVVWVLVVLDGVAVVHVVAVVTVLDRCDRGACCARRARGGHCARGACCARCVRCACRARHARPSCCVRRSSCCMDHLLFRVPE